MPNLEHKVPELTHKSMNRRMSRSAMVFSIKRANFHGFALPKIDRHIRELSDSLTELSKSVDVVIGKGDNQQVVKVKDFNAQAKIANALISLVEQQRSLLGFPSPGKRKDEERTVHDVETKPALSHVDLEDIKQQVATVETVDTQPIDTPVGSE